MTAGFRLSEFRFAAGRATEASIRHRHLFDLAKRAKIETLPDFGAQADIPPALPPAAIVPDPRKRKRGRR